MLLFRVVSTPGVGKIVALSVLFSAVPSRGGQHPHPLGVTHQRTTFRIIRASPQSSSSHRQSGQRTLLCLQECLYYR